MPGADSELVEILEAINEGYLDEALVRLWILAWKKEEDLVFNRWERNTVPSRQKEYCKTFYQQLDKNAPILPSDAEAEPFALIAAIDQFLSERAPRRKSSVPYIINSKEYYLIRTPLTRRAEASIPRQETNRISKFRYHFIVPASLEHEGASIELSIQEPEISLNEALSKLIVKGSLCAYIAHFTDKVALCSEANVAKKFFCNGISDPSLRMKSISEHLNKAVLAEADIVVFPELTVMPEQRLKIKEWRKHQIDNEKHCPSLIVAGSFHEIDDVGRKVNRTELIGATLKPFFHDKIRPFGAADGRAEDIDCRSRIELLATNIGTITFPICKDFNDAAAVSAGIDWTAIGPDWFLVPGMGDQRSINAHKKKAEEFGKLFFGSVSLIANQEFSGTFVPGFGFVKEFHDVPEGGKAIEISLELHDKNYEKKQANSRKRLKVVSKH